MKKIINSIMTMFFAVCAIGTVAAQHGGHRGSAGNRGGGHGSYASHSVAHAGGVSAYRGGGNYNRASYGRVYSNRGAVAYGHSYNNVRGGYYGGGRGLAAGRRVVVPWGAAHRYAYGRPVYFPAYHLYYDPYRCGYTYWSGGRWLFSSVLPAFLAGIDLAATQMAYANSLPQAYYPGGDGYDDGYYAPAPAPVVAAPAVGLNIHIGL